MDELDLGQTVRGFVGGQKVFARYVLQSLVGRGGMGVVWRAFDEHLERDVALKFLPELIIHDRAVLDDLKRETKRNLDLTHHHIVRIYDFAQDSQSACISMEFVDGATLSALRVDRPEKVFHPQELSQPLAELCEALTYAHTRASIVHRDLKPANLMLNSKGALKVTDFGIARSLSDSISMLTMNRGVSGTLLYMSPQQLDGERTSTLDDIYSVGATVYELLTSKPPFYSGGVERQIHEKVPPPMSVRRADLGIVSAVPIPEVWEQTVAACLAKDPLQRPQSAAALAECFRGISAPPSVAMSAPSVAIPAPSLAIPPPEPAPTVAIPPARPPVAPEASQASGRSKGLLYAGAVAGAAILIGGAAIYFSTRSTDETTRPESVTAIPAPAESAHAETSISPPVSAPPVSNITTSTPPAASSPAETTTPQHSAPYSSSDGYDPGIVFVDMQRIFKEYNKTKDAEARVNDAKNVAKKEYDDRTDVYKKRLDEINTLNAQLDAPALTAAAKRAKATERDDKIAKIKELEREINDFRTTREKQLQEQAVQMRTGIVNEITREIGSLNTASRSIVYDRSGLSSNNVPLLLFAPDRADMSNKVISALNQKSHPSFTVAHDLSFGTVDMGGIFKAYNKTKDSEAKVNGAKNDAKKEFDDRTESYKKALDGINRLNTRIDSPSLTAATREALVKERDEKIANIKTMEREINEFRQAREKQLQEQALRMREGIVKEITDAIGKGIEKDAMAVVIDVSGMSTNSVPVAVFVSGVPDFSEDVIAAINGTHGPATVRFHSSAAVAKSLRFGVIDMNRAFKLWPETKSAEAKVNEAKDLAKKEYDARTEQYKKDLAEINSLNQQLDSPSLSADAKSAKAKERDAKIVNIKAAEKAISDFRTAREKQLQEQALKMREGIVAKILTALRTTASQGNFNLVFDSSGPSTNGIPITILAPGIPDLTDKVSNK
jgi:serine/threonine protein kinase/Skp family chaperone for outer membrane proteins